MLANIMKERCDRRPIGVSFFRSSWTTFLFTCECVCRSVWRVFLVYVVYSTQYKAFALRQKTYSSPSHHTIFKCQNELTLRRTLMWIRNDKVKRVCVWVGTLQWNKLCIYIKNNLNIPFSLRLLQRKCVMLYKRSIQGFISGGY